MTRRFDTLLGIDIKTEALETFADNHATMSGIRPEAINEDIAKVDQSAIEYIAQKGENEGIDCLIGGPPCEGFSQNRVVNGRGIRTNKFIDDPRNYLFKWFVNLAADLQPKVVVIENVPDLVRHRDGETLQEIFLALDEAGYITRARVLNAANFGVPQIRRRAFFIAQRKVDFARYGLSVNFPTPTHRPYPMTHESMMDDEGWFPGDSGYWISVREAIGDLPTPVVGKSNATILAKYSGSHSSNFRSLMRMASGSIHNHIERKLGKNGYARLNALRPGQICADLPEELRPKSHHHYSYTRLVWSEPARTITKFAYHVGSGQFGHPEETRAITMREAARLQSFPDSFRFIGTDQIRELSAMVGSAVPPLLARAIAVEIAHYLDQLHLANMDPRDRKQAQLLEGDAVLKRLEKEEWTSTSMPHIQRKLI